jgi:acetoacetyl-CoA synthetase
MMPNMPETVACMLACASIGAIWSSCSPDFGVKGVLDRFGQIEPKLFISCDGYWYNGKRQEVADKLTPSQPALKPKATVIVPLLDDAQSVAGCRGRAPRRLRISSPISRQSRHLRAAAVRPSALHPVFLRHHRHSQMHRAFGRRHPVAASQGAPPALRRLEPGERLFLLHHLRLDDVELAGLRSGRRRHAVPVRRLALPPDGNVLFDYAAEERFAVLGTSAKFIDAVRKAGLEPARTHDLSSLRLLTSTGSPLSPEGFSFVYEGIKPDVHLASISGGTDIVSCFVLGNPALPVWRGEIQGPRPRHGRRRLGRGRQARHRGKG